MQGGGLPSFLMNVPLGNKYVCYNLQATVVFLINIKKTHPFFPMKSLSLLFFLQILPTNSKNKSICSRKPRDISFMV